MGFPPPVGTRCLRTSHRSVPQPQAALPAPPLGFQGCFGPTVPWQHAKSGRGHLRFLEAAVLIRRGPGAADTAQLPPPRGFSKKRRRVPRSSGGSHGRVGPGGGGGNGAGREWWWLGGVGKGEELRAGLSGPTAVRCHRMTGDSCPPPPHCVPHSFRLHMGMGQPKSPAAAPATSWPPGKELLLTGDLNKRLF